MSKKCKHNGPSQHASKRHMVAEPETGDPLDKLKDEVLKAYGKACKGRTAVISRALAKALAEAFQAAYEATGEDTQTIRPQRAQRQQPPYRHHPFCHCGR